MPINTESNVKFIFEMSYTFDATSQQIYDAWTMEEHLSQWWGPKGFAITIHKFDFSPGGTFHYRIYTPDDFEMWGKFIYGICTPFKQIEFVNSFSDKNERVIRAAFSDTWPLEILNSISLTEKNGKTELKLHAKPINATIDELTTYKETFESLLLGYEGTFEKLNEYLLTL